MATPDLSQLVEQLSKTFEKCLDNALSDPTVTKEHKGSSDIACLKSTFLDLEHQLKSIRLACLQDRNLSVTESIALLKRDIDIKQATIDKYMTQVDNWMKVLPELEQKSIGILNAPSANARSTTTTSERPDQDGDEDDDEDVEFEEV